MKNRLISFLLVVLTLFCALMLPASADDDKVDSAIEAAQKSNYNLVSEKLDSEIKAGYTDLYAQTDKYQLFCNKYTGEVYLRDIATNQYLTTNPIKVGAVQQEDKLSQIWLSYKTFEVGATEVEYNSFKMAAERGQISVSLIRGGIRVEYLLGDTSSRSVAPQAILDTDFQETILGPYQERILDIVRYDNFMEKFSAIINSKQVKVTDPETGEPVLDPETGEPTYEWVIAIPDNSNAEKVKDAQYAQKSYNLLKQFENPEILSDMSKFQKATTRDILGTAKVVKPGKTKGNEMVCTRFRYDYVAAVEEVTAALKSAVPEVKAQAEARRDMILYELETYLKVKVDKDEENPTLPDASIVGVALNDVYSDYGNLNADYKLIVDLNKDYADLAALKERRAAASGKEATKLDNDIADKEKAIKDAKKKYPILDMEPAEGETYPVIRTLDYQAVTYSDGATIKYFRKVQDYLSRVTDGKYTLTTMVAQEEKIGFEALVFDNPLFRCALEYVIDDTGVTVDIPASSIVFDESKYELTGLSFLRYFGAGSTDSDGYVFYPDGSGALIYNRSMPQSAVLNQPVYSYDYAFSSLQVNNVGDSITNSQSIRMPVFGAVNKSGDSTVGYLAVITEGDTLAHLIARKLDNRGDYIGAYATYYYRATDKYSITRLSGNTVSVWSDFKYTGKYTQKYIMLTDPAKNPAEDPDYGYRADYIGMAAAYRDYLFGKDPQGISETELKERLPFYVETFATVETVESFLSFPIEVDKPLTSFKDVQTIGDELGEKGIKNVKFRLIGYYNKGYHGTYPVRIKWMKEVGGKKGFASLMDYVEEHKGDGFDVFTDVDLLYNYKFRSLTISRKKTSARSMDDRYIMKHVYSTITRSTTSNKALLISASKLAGLFEKFDKKFSKFKSTSIALANLASDLSSNFNEDDYYSREEAKTYIVDLFKTASGKGTDERKYTVMTTGGNVYTLPYVDYLLSAPVDGSHYNAVSRTIPFFGLVMHGLLQYAGEVFNEAGDPDYELLRDIESGAGLYVVLVYQNTDLMKNDSELVKHYSSNYLIWKEDLIKYYNTLDDAIGDLQTYRISDHQFVIGERQAQKSEREEDQRLLEEEYIDFLTTQIREAKDLRNNIIRALEYVGVYHEGGSIAKTSDDLYKANKSLSNYLEKLDATKRRLYLNCDPAIDLDENPSAAKPTEAKKVAAVKKIIDEGIYPTAPNQMKYKVVIDSDAIIAHAEEALNVTVSNWFRDQLAAITEANATDEEGIADLALTVSQVENYGKDKFASKYDFVTDSEATAANYDETDYTLNDGSVVLVTYSNGEKTVRFLLNFSIFTVNVRFDGQLYTLGKYGFVRVDERGADANTDQNNAEGE